MRTILGSGLIFGSRLIFGSGLAFQTGLAILIISLFGYSTNLLAGDADLDAKSASSNPGGATTAEETPKEQTIEEEAVESKWYDKFFDDEDGKLDISEFLANPLGFIPVVIPITEPTVGLGAALAVIFINANERTSDGQPVKPNITGVGGFGTENGTKGYFGLNSTHWFEGKLNTVALLADATANLDFYGSGDQGIRYTLDLQLLHLEALYRLGNSRSMLGFGYTYGDIDSKFKTSTLPPEVNPDTASSNLGGVNFVYNYDSRDNIFTPTKGFMGEIEATFHEPSLGASSSFQKLAFNAFYYKPLTEKYVFAIRGTAQKSFGDVPFYYRPFVQLRGVPLMRYQGEQVAFTEAELRWKISNRVSLVGFAGAGITSSSYDDLSWNDDVTSGGAGIRYELARKQGLHMGLDVAYSDSDTAIYFIFGSAWPKP